MWSISSATKALGFSNPFYSFGQPWTSSNPHSHLSISGLQELLSSSSPGQIFPNEILFLIVSHSLEDFQEYLDCCNGEGHEHTGSYLKFLSLLCTVCKSWRAVVQPLLFAHLDPRSFKELGTLVRLLESEPELASYVRRISSPSLKGASPHPNRNPAWRALPFYQFEDGTVYMLSEENYHAILVAFQKLTDICPNLQSTMTAYFHTPTPLATDIQVCPRSYARLLEGRFSRIRELSLTRIILPYRDNPSLDPSKPLEKILLPELLTLNSYDFPPVFLTHLRSTFEMPKLQRLKLLHGACRLRDLANIILDAKGTMKDLYLDGRIVSGLQLGTEEDIPQSSEPWYKVLSDRDDLLGNLEVLRLRGARLPGRPPGHEMDLSPMRSLRCLYLRIYSKRSSFFELGAQIPTLEEIIIRCTFSYNLSESSFGMFNKMGDILSESRHVAGAGSHMPNLKLIRIKWLVVRTLPERDLWRAMIWCLTAMCDRRGVVLDALATLVDEGSGDDMDMKLDESSWRQANLSGYLDRALSKWWARGT